MDNQSSAARLPLRDAHVPSYVRDIVECMINEQKVLEEELSQCLSEKKLLEENVKLLNLQQYKSEAEISELQAGLGYDYSHDRECTLEKELVMERIASKSGSAAGVICKVFQNMDKELLEQVADFANNILGVVACLGIAESNALSGVLANYLELDFNNSMLAIVCKSHAYASIIAKHEPDGRVNTAYGLHNLAAQLGYDLNGRYAIICLDDLRVYKGEICSNSQRKLALQNPTLPNGNSPPGFLGFAVNMVNPGVGCERWKTSSGHGLRETLFYNLFGELQVYETTEDMNRAMSCITNGAVSLDGDIINNGMFVYGCREPEIKFPVICSETRKHFSAHTTRIMNQIDEKKDEIKETVARLEKEKEKHAQVEKKFKKLNDEYMKFFSEKGPLIDQWIAIYNFAG